MGLKDYNLTGLFTTKYSSLQTNISVNEFFRILFSNSIRYYRMTAYFGAGYFYDQLEPLQEFLGSSGTAIWYISQEISEEDYLAIKKGIINADDIKIKPLEELLNDESTRREKELNLLAWLISLGHIKIKITVSNGIVHDKAGLAIDEHGYKVAFNGSFNDTVAALKKNSESILSVDSDSNPDVVSQIEKYFQSLEQNELKGVSSFDLPNEYVDRIIAFRKDKIQTTEYVHENFLDYKEGFLTLYLNTNDLDRRRLSRISNFFDSNSSSNRLFKKRFPDDETLITNILDIMSLLKSNNLTFLSSAYINEIISFYEMNKLHFEKFKDNAVQIKDGNIDIEEFNYFKKVVMSRVIREPYELQFLSSYFAYKSINSCNFSVPGSGKTMIAYSLFSFLNSLPKNHERFVEKILVVGPLSSFAAWEDEYELTFGHSGESTRLGGYNKIRNPKSYLKGYSTTILNLINYEGLNLIEEIKTFLTNNLTLLVLDEAHYIKGRTQESPGIRASQILELSSSPNAKLLMTGTPITNSYSDLKNYLEFLWPKQISMFRNNDRDLRKLYIENSPELISHVKQLLYPFYYRINREDLGLKAKPNYNLINIDPDPIHKALYSELLRIAKFRIIAEEDSIERRIKDAITIRLMQACFNPLLLRDSLSNYGFDLDFEENLRLPDFHETFDTSIFEHYLSKNFTDTRLATLEDLVDDLMYKEKKVIIWAIFTNSIKKIYERLSKKYQVGLLFGETSDQKEVIIDAFKLTDKLNILIANPASVAESISLHKQCQTAIYYEYSYNATHWMQSKDRIYRYGLPENIDYIDYYIFKTNFMIDDVIYNKLRLKEKIMIDIIEDNYNVKLNIDEVLEETL